MGGSREWRQARIAEGKCVDCGKPRPSAAPANLRPVNPARATATRCPACAQTHRAANRALRERERRKNGILSGPLPMGGAAPRIAAVKTVTVRLDRESFACLDTLLARKRQRFRRERPSAAPLAAAFGVSRLIRAVIQSFQNERCPARRGRLFMHGALAVTFPIDAPTLALLDDHARRSFGGNRAATVRAMLVARGRPAYVTGATAGVRPSAEALE